MIFVGCGAMIGAVIRYWITSIYKRMQWNWPLATLLINLSGAFLLGILTNHFANNQMAINFWGVGVLGGYTTFSTFNTELLALIDEHRWFTMGLYLLLSYGGGIALAFLGLMI